MCPVMYQIFANNLLRSTRLLRSRRRTPPKTTLRLRGSRGLSTLPENPHIYIHPHPLDSTKFTLSLLPTSPPTPQLALGTTTSLPPTPQSFTPNPSFLPLLSSVYATHATSDPSVIQQAAVFASPTGSFLQPSIDDGGESGTGGGATGHRGWIHVSDLRNPPDYGRIAWPEDILGSVEVDARGRCSGGGWQDSGTYRLVTREGVLGMTDYMRGKMVDRLLELERDVKREL